MGGRVLIGVVALSVLVSRAGARSDSGEQWPSFRGPLASGVADGQRLPERWDAPAAAGIRWRVRVPGLAHSSPIVWGERVYVTSAISSRPDATFKPGLYGDGTASEDRSVHRFVVYAIDARTGSTVWERTTFEGEPRERRHIKATYANATPATDGRHVVALFGSQGLYAFDVDGRLLWSRDLGRLNAGAYDLPDYEWGTASSPIIWRDLVIVQCDVQQGSFLQAFDVRTGTSAWRVTREELPSWSTPTVFDTPAGPELVTNAPNRIRGYDSLTGKELWWLEGSSKITAPTPIAAGGAPPRGERTGARAPDLRSASRRAWRPHARRRPAVERRGRLEP